MQNIQIWYQGLESNIEMFKFSIFSNIIASAEKPGQGIGITFWPFISQVLHTVFLPT